MSGSRAQILTRTKYNKVLNGATGTNTGTKGKAQQSREQPCEISKGMNSNTQDESITVFVEPSDIEQTVFKHPAEIGRILASSGITGYRDIRNVGRFRFKVTFNSTGDANKVNDKKLQGTGLKRYTPTVKNAIIGLTKGVPKNFSEQEIMEQIDSNKEVTRVERVKRKGRGDELRITEQVKITFKGTEHPIEVLIYGCPFKVELYLFPIKQCANCWMYNHKTTDCKKPKKCGKCGKEHEQPECQDRVKCINCRGQHTADDRECPERLRQRKIKEAIQKEHITIAEAVEKFPKESNRFALLARMDEFPEMEASSEDSEDETNSQTGGSMYKSKSEKRKKGKVSSKNSTGGNRKGSRFRTEEDGAAYSGKNKQNNVAELRTLKRRMDRMENSLKTIGKIIRLQCAVEEQIRVENDQMSMEGLIIKISTVLKEIVRELGENIEKEDQSSEEYEENNG